VSGFSADIPLFLWQGLALSYVAEENVHLCIKENHDEYLECIAGPGRGRF
jgi:hypothetical protein